MGVPISHRPALAAPRLWLVALALVAGGLSADPAAAPASADEPAGTQECGSSPVAAPGVTPVATGTCDGVRPGGIVMTEVGRCTLNFVFRSVDGQRFVGSAGHCALGTAPESLAEVVWPVGEGPVVHDPLGRRIGEFAYAVFQRPKDFALIRVDPGVATNAEMCHFGGPTGMNDTLSAEPEILRYWGNGVGARTVAPARSALAVGLPDPDRVAAFGLAVPGDSGGGVTDSGGLALGVVVTTGPQAQNPSEHGVNAGIMGITRIGPQIRRAAEMLGSALALDRAAIRTGAAVPTPPEPGSQGG